MEPPPAFGIRFLIIDEPMPMLDQDAAEPIAEVIEHPFLGSTSLGHCPPVGRFEIGRLGREPDGAEVCQQMSGDGLKVAHGSVFSWAPSKPCSKTMNCMVLAAIVVIVRLNAAPRPSAAFWDALARMSAS